MPRVLVVSAFYILILLIPQAILQAASPIARAENKPFDMIEATVAKVHAAMTAGTLSCEQLTRGYIKRIQFFDQSSGLNSIIMINPEAMLRARELDEQFSRTQQLLPLHCAVIVVKDNYLTKGLQTTVGSKAMLGFIPDKDAWQVARLKEAGALVLAKSNMAEWAFSPRVTISSVAGETRNPYNLNYVPAGSSGGTAASVASNFALIGLGTDTGNSIRGPSSHNALVGIRSTLGLTSRSGIAPLALRNDVGGPMARTVIDAVRILQVIAGVDADDPITKTAKGHVVKDLLSLLDKDALKGARIGVMRQLSERDHDPAIAQLFEHALLDLKRLGATIVDPFVVEDFDALSQNHWCAVFRFDLNQFLEQNKHTAPLKNLKEIVAAGNYSDYIEEDLKARAAVVDPRGENRSCEDLYKDKRRVAFRKAIVEAMDSANVTAIVYPSWNFTPARVGYLDEYKGDNSQVIAPHTGMPAVTVAMGYVNDLPAGLQFTGRLFSEPQLLPLVYAYEQGTMKRKPPPIFKALLETF